MDIVIIGADGQLGTDLQKVLGNTIPLTISDIDIINEEQTKSILEKLSPNIVINTAAAHQVDNCEEKDIEAYKVNAHGAKNLALVCDEIGAALVHISTDYVFDGEKNSPYTELDNPNPMSAYGISKLAGEQFVKYLLKKYFIIRTSGLYGAAGCLGKGGGNFVENMINKSKEGQKITVVADEVLTPTYTLDLAKKISELIRTQFYGLYHITNNGQCSWYEYAKTIFELLDNNINIEKATGATYKTKANRPKYSVLENYNLKKYGFSDMPNWRDALKRYLIEKGHIPK